MLSFTSIRARLSFAFGALLFLGVLNILVITWGARERRAGIEAFRVAVQQQLGIVEVANMVEDQKRFVDLLTGVVGLQEAAAPDAEERARFARSVDAIPARLAALQQAGGAAAFPGLDSLHAQTRRLAESWKTFYALQGVETARAIEELYTRAEPLAEALLARDLPDAIARGQQRLASVDAAFVRTDTRFERLAWLSFILSTIVGVALVYSTLRNMIDAISELRAGAEAIGAGRLDSRLQIQRQDELGEVAGAFNAMSARLAERTEELERSLDDLRATQEQLVQQEKLASLGALTAGIAHEIKNPLNFVNNFAELSAELVEEIREELSAKPDLAVRDIADLLDDLELNARKVKEHGRRADGIVRSMLEHSRGGETTRERVDLNRLVDEYVNLAYHGMRAQKPDFNAQIDRAYDPAVADVEIVPQEIGRVLLNLLGNAFYAVHAHRSDGHDSRMPTVRVSTARTPTHVVVTVEDNGPGIPPEVQKKIFEPFFTTKPTGEGTGLGLSLSHEIITQGHGGTLQVESEAGTSTTFTITLPVPASP